MDVYGHGEFLGGLLVAYCRAHNIDIDALYREIEKDPHMFVSGIGDGIDGKRDSSNRSLCLDLEFLQNNLKGLKEA